MPPIAGFARPAGAAPCDSDVVGQTWIPTVDDLWTIANELFPGKMDTLLKMFTDSIGRIENNQAVTPDAPEPTRALLEEIYAEDEYEAILKTLTEDTKNQYMEKISSLLIHRFSKDERITKTQSGPCVPSYIRLGSIGTDENVAEAIEPDDERHSVRQSLYSPKSLQLALLFNELVGSSFSTRLNDGRLYAYKIRLAKAKDEAAVGLSFGGLEECFNDMFKFTEHLGTGIEITAGPHSLPTGGQTDFSVKVAATNTAGRFKEPVTEYPAIIEFKRPNAGLGIAWKLLNGHSWTLDSKNAFFELRSTPLPDVGMNQSAMWTAAETVFDKVKSSDVDVKYSETEAGSFGPSYFVTTLDNGDLPEDITSALSAAGFKICLDNCHRGLMQVVKYATFNNCTRVAIADGLTFIAGSYNKLTICDRSNNPGRSEHVLDAHFDSTFMMQTHENDSALYTLNYLCDAVMSSSRFRCLGYQILLDADELFPDEEISPMLQKGLFEKIRNRGTLVFDSLYHNVQRESLKSSQQYLTTRERMAIGEFLASLPKELQELSDDAASADFAVCEWFRESNFTSYASYGPFPGRSKSVAKVQLHSDVAGKHYVLKEYFGDEDSIARMKVELDAYWRVRDLDEDNKKHVAELKAFGSLDLEEGLPRLFLLLEYVEEPDQAPVDKGFLGRELTKVNNLLKSVDVHHNDLDKRNYMWQRDSDGSWYIKVFDFDHATIEKPTMKRKHSNVK